MIEELDNLLYHKAIKIMTSEKKNNLCQFKLEEDVTGEGQKTSSVLRQALSCIEGNSGRDKSHLSDRSWSKCKSYLSVKTEETQLGSYMDQVLSYLYYSGYAECSTLTLSRTHL
jgi:hypothetical protein